MRFAWIFGLFALQSVDFVYARCPAYLTPMACNQHRGCRWVPSGFGDHHSHDPHKGDCVTKKRLVE